MENNLIFRISYSHQGSLIWKKHKITISDVVFYLIYTLSEVLHNNINNIRALSEALHIENVKNK